MRVFTNTEFKGYWPVGTAAVVIANSAGEAAQLLERELFLKGIKQGRIVYPSDMIEVDTTKQSVLILQDGNY